MIVLNQPLLARAAAALETLGGASTANANPAGLWLRIATAAEAIANTTPAADAGQNWPGSMLRTAIALETMSGTDGTEENDNTFGMVKRLYEAAEAIADETFAGREPFLRFVLAVEEMASAGTALVPLGIDNAEIDDDAEVGETVGTLTGMTDGSSLSLEDDAGGLFALDGDDIEVDGELTAGVHEIVVRETLAAAMNSPRDTTIAITVNEAE